MQLVAILVLSFALSVAAVVIIIAFVTFSTFTVWILFMRPFVLGGMWFEVVAHRDGELTVSVTFRRPCFAYLPVVSSFSYDTISFVHYNAMNSSQPASRG